MAVSPKTEARFIFRDGTYEVFEVWYGGRSSYHIITPFGEQVVCATVEEAWVQVQQMQRKGGL